ncbi:MAG: apaH [Paucimonas sp.]|nr:apaH [Paucimonas sp.]
MSATYAIGDVQGCDCALAQLLDRLRQAGDPDPYLLFVGDLVNRGPESLASLRRMKALGDTGAVVLGNHDLHLLAAAHGIRKPHGQDTLHDILEAPDCGELLDWLRQQPLARMHEGHLVVHAGVLPQWTVPQVLALSREVEDVLQGPHWLDFLAHMYGNTPEQWDDSLRGHERLRCIVNALTRLRFCDAGGRMEFQTKEGAGAAPPGYMPWFEVPGRKTAGTPIVCGHWSTLGLVMRPDLLALDTGCVWGGKLSAVRLHDRALFQVDCERYREPG